MKKHLKILLSLFMVVAIMGTVDAQNKSKIKTKPEEPKYVEQNFGSPSSVTDVTDVADTSLAYLSVKNLLDKNVTLAYQDNSFQGNEPIRRGDFLVALNSAIDAIKKVETENGIDSLANVSPVATNNDSMVSDNEIGAASTNEAGTTDLSEIPESSVYHPAAQSLMQKGIVIPFEKTKTFNPGTPMAEKEVYNILNSVFGYSTAGMNPYANTMSRSKFAMALNNAVSKQLQQDYAVIDQKNAEAEQARQAEQQRLQSEMQQQEQMKRDSLNSAYQAEQMEIEKRAQENQGKKKRK